ncbi:MAG: hypothetical protein E7215_08895 [Clostridium sulfidigenes]|uniref:Uncharacterized protein n=1 Tax=Clostridium sulfidigenes TaxID=318464 RepID=A0A927WAT0_9CLOT|nr:hypothetical protein [Clostridium sulfidigenes]
MSEENITIELVRILRGLGWDIISFDFPQSGTGLDLKPNDSNEKNKDNYKPDIIVAKDGIALITENKVNYYEYDITKLNTLRETEIYSNSLDAILSPYNVELVYYGAALKLNKKNKEKLDNKKSKIDFSLLYDESKKVFIINYLETNYVENDKRLIVDLTSTKRILIK